MQTIYKRREVRFSLNPRLGTSAAPREEGVSGAPCVTKLHFRVMDDRAIQP